MNSYRCQRTLRNKLLAAVALVAVVAIPVAHAQEPQPTSLDELMESGKNVKVPVVKDTPLPPNATVSNSDDQIKAMASENGRALDNLLGAALSDERENNDVKTFAMRQRQQMDAEAKLKLGKTLKELWKELNGEGSETDKKLKDLEVKVGDLTAQNEALRTKNNELQMVAPAANIVDPDPVVVSIAGGAGRVEAKILVPYAGEMVVRPGDTLPNGQKVTSVNSSGVTVSQNGQTKILAFGTSVPRTRPQRMVMPTQNVTVFPN